VNNVTFSNNSVTPLELILPNFEMVPADFAKAPNVYDIDYFLTLHQILCKAMSFLFCFY